MIIVSWGDGNVAAVDDVGAVIDASSPAAQREIEAAMKEPVFKQGLWEGRQTVEQIDPGRPGHVRAVLERLEGALLTD